MYTFPFSFEELTIWVHCFHSNFFFFSSRLAAHWPPRQSINMLKRNDNKSSISYSSRIIDVPVPILTILKHCVVNLLRWACIHSAWLIVLSYMAILYCQSNVKCVQRNYYHRITCAISVSPKIISYVIVHWWVVSSFSHMAFRLSRFPINVKQQQEQQTLILLILFTRHVQESMVEHHIKGRSAVSENTNVQNVKESGCRAIRGQIWAKIALNAV